VTITGRWTDRGGVVYVDGRRLDPRPSQAVWNHSPTGFCWGYAGSGPAQLALAILLHAGLTPRQAVHYHQRFKREVIAPLPRNAFQIEIDVGAWIASQDDATTWRDLDDGDLLADFLRRGQAAQAAVDAVIAGVDRAAGSVGGTTDERHDAEHARRRRRRLRPSQPIQPGQPNRPGQPDRPGATDHDAAGRRRRRRRTPATVAIDPPATKGKRR
jgi:hypothetical protein